MDATILNYSKASFEALYSDNIRKNVAVEDLKRGIIALNSKDDTVKEATNFTSQVIVISEELKMNLEDKVLSLEEDHALSVIVITQAHVMELVYGMLEKVEDDAPSRETRWIRGLGRGPQEQLVPSSSETSISVA
ncbi:hypothetical protein V6N13_042001 [Hibiscus sabdariffa]